MRNQKIMGKIQIFFVLAACLGILMLYLSHRPKDEIQFVSSAVETAKGTTNRQVSNPINFEAYRKLNPDVYAYLYIDNSSLDYPILQHPSDDAYYLSHGVDGEVSAYGSIYTEGINTKDFHDPNTVIYGHNVMDYGTMFHELLQYQNADYFNQHKLIYIYTKQGIYQYQVFASYFYDDRHLLYAFDFHNPAVYQAFLDGVFQRQEGIVDRAVSVDTTDTIITLSTCKDLGDERFLVQAVLKQFIPCPAQTSVAVSQEMKAMKEPQIITKRPGVKQNLKKVVKKPTLKQELRAALPYFLTMITVILSYAVIRICGHKHRKVKTAAGIFSIRDKLQFAIFLLHAGLKAIVEKMKFMRFLLSQLMKALIERCRFFGFLIKQFFKDFLGFFSHRA